MVEVRVSDCQTAPGRLTFRGAADRERNVTQIMNATP